MSVPWIRCNEHFIFIYFSRKEEEKEEEEKG